MQEMTYYMIQTNLRNIKNNVDYLLSVDPTKMDELLKNGHDWANDHITSSNDDIDEVYSFIKNNIDSNEESEEPFIKTFESYIANSK
jgi:hypothetical protein